MRMATPNILNCMYQTYATSVLGISGHGHGPLPSISTIKTPPGHAETPRSQVMGLVEARSPCTLPMVQRADFSNPLPELVVVVVVWMAYG